MITGSKRLGSIAAVTLVGSLLALGCGPSKSQGDTSGGETTPRQDAPATPTTDFPAAATATAISRRTATPTPAPTPVPGACPVSRVACDAASIIAEAVVNGVSLQLRLRTTSEACPGEGRRPPGSPFPLCDGASAGEIREGVWYAGSATGFFHSAANVAALIGQLADGRQRDRTLAVWRPYTIGCPPHDERCESRFVLVFLPTTPGGGRNVVAGPTGDLSISSFEVVVNRGIWQISRFSNFGYVPLERVPAIAHGGVLENPPHIALVDFSTYYRWSPSK